MIRYIKKKLLGVVHYYRTRIYRAELAKVCRIEFQHQAFSRFNERPVEFGFVFRKLAEIYPRTILDIGTGTTALPHLMRNCGFEVTATDNVRDYWTGEMVNRHFHIINDDITSTKLKKKFDLITCISVLEQIKDSDSAIRGMFSLLEPGGYLILTFPYNENRYCENVYKLPNSSYGKNATYVGQAYSRENLNHWLEQNGGKIIEQEFRQFWEGEFWTEGKQIIPPEVVSSGVSHHHSCLLIQKCSPSL
jgi:2-polyprenyl-3-methyl-5-hydroxy-6-metoxy-1,4-benzoquinol methylase